LKEAWKQAKLCRMRAMALLLLLALPLWAEDWTVGGKVYRNVAISGQTTEAVSVTYDGGVGQFNFCDLPPELQKRFGYDASKAKADLEVEKQQNQEAAKIEAAQKLEAEKEQKAQEIKEAEDRITEDIEKSKTDISASVFQKTDDGLLLSLDVMMSTENGAMPVPYDYNPIGARKVILLQDSEQEKDAADNDRLYLSAYPIGTYSYTATDGSTATVKRFTADLNKALFYWANRANTKKPE